MKKLTISVATLLIAGTSYIAGTNYSQCVDDEVTFTRYEVMEMLNTIEEILSWQQEDMEEGVTNMGKHSEGWGSNYWLTEMRDELYNKLNIKE